MATPYHVKVTPNAQKQILALSSKLRRPIVQFAETLAINPRPQGATKIEGMTGLYSQELPPLRLIYKIENQDIILLAVK